MRKTLAGRDVSKGDEVEVLVPKSNSVVQDILDEFAADQERLEEMPSVEEVGMSLIWIEPPNSKMPTDTHSFPDTNQFPSPLIKQRSD